MRAAGQATRERILVAAKAEFAQYGIAGARVNRIADAAKASKDRLYAYFAGKDELYAAVTAEWVTQTTDETALDAADLPGYVGGSSTTTSRTPTTPGYRPGQRSSRPTYPPPKRPSAGSSRESWPRFGGGKTRGWLPGISSPSP